RGARDPERAAEKPCRDRRCGGLRRPWPQVSDLGARALPRATRGGHREGARAQEAIELPEGGARCGGSTGMTMGGGAGSCVAGGPARHIPVRGAAAVEYLNVRDGGPYIDATFGAGGHSRLILDAAACRVIAIDRDQSAVARGADLVDAAGGRLTLV